MPIKVVDKPTVRRGEKDARRHREKQKEAIRERLPEILAEEAIITRRKGKKVKIPIKMLDIPHFRPEKKGSGGAGQGSGKPGDIIGRRPGQPGGGERRAGDQPGEDYVETEIDIEELIEMMLEDLGLPNIAEKTRQELEVILGFQFKGIERQGPRVLLEKKQTSREAFRRFLSYLEYLKEETGRSEEECEEALRQAEGILEEALALLSDPNFSVPKEEREEEAPFIFEREDLRYYKIQKRVRPQSNAVIFAQRDISGSMHAQKKYLSRALLFWLVEYLRRLYEKVEIRFIVHHTEARIVLEDDFFKLGESGGTYCYTAFELANSLVKDEYPPSAWNIYSFLFSDGDDFEPQKTAEEIGRMLAQDVNMVGYAEISIDYRGEPLETRSSLLPELKKAFPLEESTKNGLTILQGPREIPLLCAVVKGKEHILPVLQEFLKRERWRNVE